MDENLTRLSALTQISVPSVSSGLSNDGGVQIAPASHSNAGQVAVRKDDGWWFYQPFSGMSAWVRDVSAWFVYDGSVWRREASAAYVISPIVTASRMLTEAEFSVGATIEVSSANDVTLTVPAPGTTPAQMGASVARRPVSVIRTGTGQVSVAAAAGSTLLGAENAFSAREVGSAMVIVPLSGDRYLIGGDVA
ncbi:DUF2793 domain-containing protein [Paenirhodobacter populi]|nr:DUF2793 domain-containing protein [Sinirhodobacter populi]